MGGGLDSRCHYCGVQMGRAEGDRWRLAESPIAAIFVPIIDSCKLVPNGVGEMPDYRVYCRGVDGRFVKVNELSAKDDESAIEKTKALKLDSRCELWESSRLVAEVPGYWV